MIFPFFLEGKRGRKEGEALDDRGKELLAPTSGKRRKELSGPSSFSSKNAPFVRVTRARETYMQVGEASMNMSAISGVSWYSFRRGLWGVSKKYSLTPISAGGRCVFDLTLCIRDEASGERDRRQISSPSFPPAPYFPLYPWGKSQVLSATEICQLVNLPPKYAQVSIRY